MSDKDSFDALMKLAEFHFNSWDTRRKAEQWKLTLALWALLAAAIRFSPPAVQWWQFLVVGCVLSVLHVTWYLSLLESNRLDRVREQSARLSALSYVEAAFDQHLLVSYKKQDAILEKARGRQDHTMGLFRHWAVWPSLLITFLMVGGGTWLIYLQNRSTGQELNLQSHIRSLETRVSQSETRLRDAEQTLSRLSSSKTIAPISKASRGKR